MVLINPAVKLTVLILIELSEPTFRPTVLITPVLEILANVAIPATPRVPVLDVPAKNAPPPKLDKAPPLDSQPTLQIFPEFN